jgi:hypothetical protein
MKTATIATLAAALFAHASLASAGPPAPAPAPELEQNMKFFEGSFKCDGKMEAGAMGPGSPAMPYKASIKFKKDKALGGFWYAGEYEIKKAKDFPGMKAMIFVGYDGAAKKLVGMGVDSTGGWRTDGSTGFAGDKMVIDFEGSMMGQKMQGRETITKKGDKEFGTVMELKMGADYKKLSEDSCKK